MKIVRRILSALLVSVLLMTPFAAIHTYAEEREEKAFWHFAVTNFKCGVQVENVAIKEYYEEALGSTYDYETLYDTWEAHLETEDGEIASGQIEPLVQYYLVIRVDGISGEALKYTSLVTCGNRRQPYPAYVYEYYYQDESSVIAKFKLNILIDELPDPLVFNIEGYGVGADPQKVKITCESEYISVDGGLSAPTVDLLQSPIQEGVKYRANIELNVPYGYEIADNPGSIEFVIKGLDEDIVGELDSYWGNGVILQYGGYVSLPALGEPLEKIEEFDFSIEGYEKGNTASQIKVKSGNEDIVIVDSFLSKYENVIERQDDEYILEIGKGYTFAFDIEIPKGYDIECISIPTVEEFQLSTVTVNGFEVSLMAKRTREVYERFRVTAALPILYIEGDVDFDGECTVADALFLLRIASKLAYEQGHILTVADLDGDGEITVSDALAVLRLAAKLDQE